ncbi:hypothetical protein Vretimale_1779 [Volvox reticuliferus]|uniref:Uncharacterized protein n=1 Tax=Volvox reticuliferus TaxID=1737510 RepID=A0A8J4D575_9CHLO|nr:hypothetical protein Vretifemale_15345 [Volvox reticuliferus]GIL95847.1 hypothetical protein Vretimale_1779 [Volvox reticuliferus]
MVVADVWARPSSFAILGQASSTWDQVQPLRYCSSRRGHSKWLLRFARRLQKFTDARFNMAYVAVFDYIMFLFNCRYGAPGHPHQFWADVRKYARCQRSTATRQRRFIVTC